MAATYIMRVAAATNAINKTYFTLFNGSGSSKIIRVYKIYTNPISSAAVTGGFGIYILDKFTGTPGGGAAITWVKQDTASAAVPVQITALNGNTSITGSLTTAGVLRQICRSNDEPAVSSLTVDELQNLYPLNIIWDGGYGDSNVEPIVLRETEGLRMYSTNAGTWGASTMDISLICTIT